MGKRRGRRVNATGRNGDEQFIPVSYPMAKSAAWRALSGTAVKVWIELRARYNGGNNGALHLSLDEAAQLLGLGKATVSRAYVDLVEKGFVVMTRPGHWYGRQATLWRVTDRGTHGQPPTNDWKRWNPTVPSSGAPSKKTGLGSEADHTQHLTVPFQNREAKSCSDLEPVAPISAPVIGSEMERLYYHALSQTEPHAVKAPLHKALANPALGLSQALPGGSASLVEGSAVIRRSALPPGPATEAAMAEKRRATS